MRTGTHDITLGHVLDAPPAAVFDTYVDPVADRIIFAGGLDWTVEVPCEVRLGGLWTIAIAARGGRHTTRPTVSLRSTGPATWLSSPR